MNADVTAQGGQTPELWALHIQGPDDIHAAPSREAAEQAAESLREWWEARPQKAPYDPRMAFVVIRWPFTPEGHEAAVKQWDAMFGGKK